MNRIVILGAERTNSLTAVALTLENGKSVIVGNGIINKVLTNDLLNFATFRALCAVGGYTLVVDGKIVAHKAKDAHESGTYARDGFHMELEEDVFPSIELSNSPIAIQLILGMPSDREAQLLTVATGALKSTKVPQGKIDPNTEFSNPDVVDETEVVEEVVEAKTGRKPKATAK